MTEKFLRRNSESPSTEHGRYSVKNLEFKAFNNQSDLSENEIRQAYEIYKRLFGSFAMTFDEVLETISDKDSVNFLVEDFSEEEKKVIGFCAGLPLSKFDLIPEKLRGLVKFMMPKSFFVLAIGITQDKQVSQLKTLKDVYRELLEKVTKQGYKNIYTMARATKLSADGSPKKATMSHHLQKIAKAKRIYTVEDFVPGEDFDLLRIGNINELLEQLSPIEE